VSQGLGHDTLGVELEAEWARQHPRTVAADARTGGDHWPLMAHGGWASPAAALRYQHVAQRRAEGLAQRMGEEVAAAREQRERGRSRTVVDLDRARNARATAVGGEPLEAEDGGNPCGTRVPGGGADGNRTHDPLLANQDQGSTSVR